LIIDTIKPYILELYMDPYGNHVLEKLVACFTEEDVYFIYKLVFENFMLMANHPNSLSIVKKVIIHCKSIYSIENIINLIRNNSNFLIQNIYGNYTIHTVLEVYFNIN
jgi:Pumilio-family RNA binding repeat